MLCPFRLYKPTDRLRIFYIRRVSSNLARGSIFCCTMQVPTYVPTALPRGCRRAAPVSLSGCDRGQKSAQGIGT